jgi:hypothetical protein
LCKQAFTAIKTFQNVNFTKNLKLIGNNQDPKQSAYAELLLEIANVTHFKNKTINNTGIKIIALQSIGLYKLTTEHS